MAEHNELGTKGEERASDFLQKKGYRILASNWRNNHHEIDIVARYNNTLVVAEVKTRTGRIFGEPEEFVLKQKQKNLIRAANAYLVRNNLDIEVRFDIISIVVEKEDKFVINHIEDAFSAVV
jgi:putative endonuclease